MNSHRLVGACIAIMMVSLVQAQMFEQWRHKDYSAPSGDNILGSVATDASSNYFVAGSDHDGVGFRERILLLKYSPGGRLIWRYLDDSTGFDSRAYAVTTNSDGSCYVSCAYRLLKISEQGQLVWARSLPGLGEAVVASESGVYVTSHLNGDVWVGGFSPEGDLRWFDTFDSGNEDWGEQIQFDVAGDIVVTATLNNVHDSNRKNVGVLKYSVDGSRRWVKTISFSTYSDVGRATIDRNNNIIVAGNVQTISNGGSSSTFVTKLNSRGLTMWFRISDHNFGREEAALGQCDASGNIYLAVTYQYGPVFGIKYSPNGELIHEIATDLSVYRVGRHASDEFGNIYCPLLIYNYRPSTIVCKVSNSGKVEWIVAMYDRTYHQKPHAVVAPDKSVYVSAQSSPGSGWSLLSAKFAPK